MANKISKRRLFFGLIIASISGIGLLLSAAFLYLSPQLPSPESLRHVELKTPLRIYTADNKLIGEFGEERRIPIHYQQIPAPFIHALLSAEDDGFYQHHGVDITGLLRAVSQLLTTGHIQSGGSTITMQVAKNYFLTHKRTFSRKFREILLAIQIERALTKDEILALYINKIFLGNRAYGIAAAAQVYYGKDISELNVAQYAMIAGLPKAPSAYNPIVNPTRALSRRNWILGRMQSLGYIDQQTYDNAIEQPVTAKYHGLTVEVNSPYVAEMARQDMFERYGKAAYSKGFDVHTTINSALQVKAQSALVKGLKAYDLRHGYRGPEAQIDLASVEDPVSALASFDTIADMQPALVMSIDGTQATLLLKNTQQVTLYWRKSFTDLRRYISENKRGRKPTSLTDIIAVGDIIRVQVDGDNQYHITQLPAVEGAIVSLSPTNGAIQSLAGGFDFAKSNFNRVLQANRQLGSNIKPFIYSAALDAGLTSATIINDAPVVFDSAQLEAAWRPVNSSGNFYGPTRLRRALYTSRNLVSIRVLKQVGINRAINYMARFGFDKNTMPRDLSLALGSYALTPMRLVTAYASLANGGYRVTPYLIDRIEDNDNNVVFQAKPATVCRDCNDANSDSNDENIEANTLADLIASDDKQQNSVPAKRIIDERIAYIIDSILQDVITKGTGRRAKVLKRSDLAGKTGTTNGPTDAWFSGYNQDIVTTAWVGFDRYGKLGRHEYGGSAALPIWIDYMSLALKNSPDRHRQQPPGIVSVRIDPATGKLASPGQSDAIFEIFRVENAPKERANQGDDQQNIEDDLMLEDQLF